MQLKFHIDTDSLTADDDGDDRGTSNVSVQWLNA